MPKRIWTEEQKNDIKCLYEQEGWTIKQIEKKYHSGHGNVSKILDELGVKKKRNLSKNRLLKEDYFENINSSEKAYFLGLLFTDGSIVLDKNNQRAPSLFLELVETDLDILLKLKDALKSEIKLSYNKRCNRENGTYTFSLRNQKIIDDLYKWNIIPNKTYQVREIIFPNNYEKDFLRGLIDGDGSLYFSNGSFHINICGYHENIIKQISDYANVLINKNKSNKIQCSNNVYKYTWNGNDAIKLAKILYDKDCLAIERKKKIALEVINKSKI